MTMTLAQLEKLLAPAPPPPITADRARHEILGAMKLMARLAGVAMHEDVYPTELFVRRVDELETAIAAQRQEIARLRKALTAISGALEAHTDPFGVRPPSKWTKTEMGTALLAAAETIVWATQRIDNELDPAHAQPIAPDPEPGLIIRKTQ